MTKFILHGGFTRKDNELNRSFFEEFARDIPDGGNVLMVFFASRSDDPTETYRELQDKFLQQASGKSLDFVYATKEDFLEQLQQADAIYLHGGSTNKLLELLRIYPDLKPLIEGKTVAGSSAGAYAIAKYGASHSQDVVREGMDWLSVRAVCHYESPELPPAPGAVEALKNMATDLELVLLKDCEWRVFNYKYAYRP